MPMAVRMSLFVNTGDASTVVLGGVVTVTVIVRLDGPCLACVAGLGRLGQAHRAAMITEWESDAETAAPPAGKPTGTATPARRGALAVNRGSHRTTGQR